MEWWNGLEQWNGMVEWNGGMEWWTGMEWWKDHSMEIHSKQQDSSNLNIKVKRSL